MLNRGKGQSFYDAGDHALMHVPSPGRPFPFLPPHGSQCLIEVARSLCAGFFQCLPNVRNDVPLPS